MLHDMDRALTAASDAYSAKIDDLAAEVNSASAGVAEFNGAIKQATMAGLPVNELMDKRDVLVSKLATLVGATAQAGGRRSGQRLHRQPDALVDRPHRPVDRGDPGRRRGSPA